MYMVPGRRINKCFTQSGVALKRVLRLEVPVLIDSTHNETENGEMEMRSAEPNAHSEVHQRLEKYVQ